MTVLDAYEGVGAVQTGTMSEAELDTLERACKPSIGACAGQFTANTMAMVSEVLGLTVPNSAMIPGVYSERLAVARRAGEIVMDILKRGGPLPRELVTRKSLENASAIVAATGGSTNAALHIPAIANEAGIAFTVDDVAEVFARTPLIGDLRPGGKYLAKDVHEIGGVSVVIRAMLRERPPARRADRDGPKLSEEHGKAPQADGAVIRAKDNALHPNGGLAVLKGNLAPDGALLKVAGLKVRSFEGTARVFDSEDDCARAVQSRDYKAGDVLVIRYEGPRGGPGMREMLGVTALIYGQQMGEKGRAAHRRPLLRRDARDCASATSRRRPRAAGRSRWLKDGDKVRIDADTRRIDVLVDDAGAGEAQGRVGRAQAAPSGGAAGEVRGAGRAGGSGRRDARGGCGVAWTTPSSS